MCSAGHIRAGRPSSTGPPAEEPQPGRRQRRGATACGLEAAAVCASEPWPSRRDNRDMSDALAGLQRWYLANCDGDWEHTYGVEILTLDNPGWSVEIHVEDTPLAGAPFEPVKIERSDSDWLTCWVGVPDRPDRGRVQEEAFQAYCGPANLEEAIGVFLDWSHGSGLTTSPLPLPPPRGLSGRACGRRRPAAGPWVLAVIATVAC